MLAVLFVTCQRIVYHGVRVVEVEVVISDGILPKQLVIRLYAFSSVSWLLL